MSKKSLLFLLAIVGGVGLMLFTHSDMPTGTVRTNQERLREILRDKYGYQI